MSVVPPIRRSRRMVPALLALLSALVVACAPAAPPSPTAAPAKPAPTAAPAKPAEAPAAKPAEAKPAAKPTEAPAAKPAAAPASPAAKPAEAKPAPKQVSLPKPEVTSLKIAIAALETNLFMPQLAKGLDLYKKYGLENVEILYVEGAARTLQTVVAGQVDAIATGAGSAFSAIKAGQPLIIVTSGSAKLTDDLVTVAGVKSAADLKGKPVAVSSFGGDSHLSVILSLKALGLAEKDVTVQQIGGQSARIAALKAGSVAAAPVDFTIQEEMKKQGFNILVHLPDSPLRVARGTLMFSQEFVRKNPNTVLAVVAAQLEAMQILHTDTNKAIDVYANWTQQKDRSQAERIIKLFIPTANRTFRWSKEGLEIIRDVQATIEPEVKDLDVTKAYSFEFLDKLQQLGFNDAVGVPKS